MVDAQRPCGHHGAMKQPDPPARMPPVQPEDYTDETRAFFGKWTGGFLKGADSNPVLQTFAHNPALAEAFRDAGEERCPEHDAPLEPLPRLPVLGHYPHQALVRGDRERGEATSGSVGHGWLANSDCGGENVC